MSQDNPQVGDDISMPDGSTMHVEKVTYNYTNWTCPNCKQEVSGEFRTCPNCGATQGDNTTPFHGRGAEITDKAKIVEAEQGEDIICPYCSARNEHNAKQCHQCGGDLTTGKHMQTSESFESTGLHEYPKKTRKVLFVH